MSSQFRQALEELAERLGFTLRYEILRGAAGEDAPSAPRSGSYFYKGQRILVVDKRLSDDEKARVLGREIARLGCEDVFMPPTLREFLEGLEA